MARGRVTAGALICFVAIITYIWGIPSYPDERPNVIFILIDDMGLEMSNAYGSEGLVEAGELYPYSTPRMDEFAGEAMRFENAFATPSCAPTRSQFLTGRYPFRTGITYPTLPNGPLDASEITLARILQFSGYHTGLAGKWNLRFGIPDSSASITHRTLQLMHIQEHGFDESHTFVGHTINYGSAFPETDYVPYQINQWVLEFLNQNANQEQPFYLQYSLGLIHTPLDPTPLNPDTATYPENYLNMVAYTDKLIGKVLDKVDQLGIAHSTVIILAGDNGSLREVVSRFRSGDLSGRKLRLWDLGSRVPFLVRWPDVIEKGSVYEGLTDFSDIFTTIIDICGGTIPGDRIIDGISFLPQLAGESEPHREYVYCQMLDGKFIRNSNFKWIITGLNGVEAGLYAVNDLPLEESIIPEPYTTGQQAARDQLEQAYTQLINAPVPNYQTWLQELQEQNPALNPDPESDEDSDGYPLLAEYAFGGHPLIDTGTPFPVMDIVRELDGDFLQFRNTGYRADITYRIEDSQGLTSWQEMLDVDASNGGYFVQGKTPIPESGSTGFLRFVVQLKDVSK